MILVTSGTGYIGSHTRTALAKVMSAATV